MQIVLPFRNMLSSNAKLKTLITNQTQKFHIQFCMRVELGHYPIGGGGGEFKCVREHGQFCVDPKSPYLP
jgi:hypothetical protein